MLTFGVTSITIGYKSMKNRQTTLFVKRFAEVYYRKDELKMRAEARKRRNGGLSIAEWSGVGVLLATRVVALVPQMSRCVEKSRPAKDLQSLDAFERIAADALEGGGHGLVQYCSASVFVFPKLE